MLRRNTERVLVVLLLLSAPGALAQSHVYLDRSLQGEVGRPAWKIMVVPPDVAVSEISAGGIIEKVPDWSNQARQHVVSALRGIAPPAGVELVNMPALSAAERETLEQHVALYDLLAGNVQGLGLAGGPAWKERVDSGVVDYTLGPGLEFLARDSRADAALFVIVRDFVSSGERKALFVFGALFGVAIPLGRTFSVAGLVDLKTGKLLWQSFDTGATPDMRIAEDARKVIEGLFQSFPRSKLESALR